MRIKLITVMVALISAASVLASQEGIATCKSRSLTLVCQPMQSFSETTVRVEATGDRAELRLESMRVSNKEFDLRVPKEALADLAVPLLDTLRVVTEAGYDKTPWMYVTITLANPKPDGPWDSPTVYLKIKDGKFVGRSVKRRVGDQITYDDLPLAATTQPASATQPAPPTP